jgi:hypothetical protein
MRNTVAAFAATIILAAIYGWLPDIALLVGASFTALIGFLYLWDWHSLKRAEHIRDQEYAKLYGKIALGNTIKGMRLEELDYMRIHGSEIYMITSGADPVYVIRCGGSRDLLREFMHDFLMVSHQHDWPYLYPVRDAKTNGILSTWESPEENATIATRKMVVEDEIAYPAAGNKPARIKDGYTFLDVCRKYGISL